MRTKAHLRGIVGAELRHEDNRRWEDLYFEGAPSHVNNGAVSNTHRFDNHHGVWESPWQPYQLLCIALRQIHNFLPSH